MRTHRRTWRAAHPELERDSSRTWQSTHPERRRATEQRRRARIAGVLTTLTADEWEAILESAGHVCIYCGSQDSLTMDHVVPISKGGQHVAENIVPACLSCNSSKGPQLISEFLSEENTSRKVAF
jgi:5-methylcytosine-specific restriction endonuclease McrA